MFTTAFMNNDSLEILLGHFVGKNNVWVEKGYSHMKINGVVLFWLVQSLRMVKGVRNV